MKRFYKDVAVEDTQAGYRILLDSKPVLTPGRNTLLLPTDFLAEAIAEEWRAQGEEIKPAAMPMLRLANTTLDGIAKTREEVIAAILRFGEHDLLCYRAEDEMLAARQKLEWDPLLDWAATSYGARLKSRAGIEPIAQPAAELEKLRAAIAKQDNFALAGLHVLASITGSLVLALAISDAGLDSRHAFSLSRLDEDYQAEKWGLDAEAAGRAEMLGQEITTAAAFLAAARD